MDSILGAVRLFLDVVWLVIIAHIIMSWLVNFQVLNLRQPLIARVWYALTRMLEPIYGPVRRVLPPMQGLDLAPLVVLIALIFLRRYLPASPLGF